MKRRRGSRFPYRHELPDERSGRHELMKMFSRRFDDIDEEEFRRAVENAAKDQQAHRSAASTYKVLGALYRLYLFYAVEKTLPQRLGVYRKKLKIRIKANTHPFAAILRVEHRGGKDVEWEWVRAIRYATVRRVLPEALPQFLKENSGIGGCSEKFNALVDPRRAKTATLVRPHSGEVPIAATPSFRRMLRRKIEKHRDRKKHYVDIVGHLASGRLTLRFV
jgi:hypothetical protein